MKNGVLGRFARHSAIRNAVALYVAQAAGIALPLVTLPYLSRVLEPKGWGRLLFAQSFAIWSSIFIEFGFNLSASRRIAQHRDDQDRVANIVAGVWGAKALLALPLLLGATALAMHLSSFQDHHGYIYWALAQALAMGFSPFWFFQGTERMTGVVVLEVLGRMLVTGVIFLIVQAPEDGWKVLALQAVAGVCTTAIPTYWMCRRVKLQRPRWRDSTEALRDGAGVFLFRMASAVGSNLNLFVLGLLAVPSVVGYYGGGERLVSALMLLTGPLSQALYPHMSRLITMDRRKAASLARVSTAVVVGMGVVVASVAAAGAPWIVRTVLGADYSESVPVLRILALALPLRAASNVFGMQWLLPSGNERIVNLLVTAMALIDVSVAVLLVPGSLQDGMAWAVLASEFVGVLGFLIAARSTGMFQGKAG